MSPALLTKYLQAARLVADHMFLNPDGFEFAPHPMLVETDREKFCIQQIVDFYDRQSDRLRRLLPRGVDLQTSVGVRQTQGDARRHRGSEQSQRAIPDDHLAGARDDEGGRRSARKAADDVARTARPVCAEPRCRERASASRGTGSDRESAGPRPRRRRADARFRRADAQGHVAQVCEPGRKGAEHRVAAAHELEESPVRDAPPRFRARSAAGRG